MGNDVGLCGSLPPLAVGDAVAAMIQVEDGGYLMQHRDAVPEIWYADYWGCFGGAVQDGEDPLEALRRELYEELEHDFREATYFTSFRHSSPQPDRVFIFPFASLQRKELRCNGNELTLFVACSFGRIWLS